MYNQLLLCSTGTKNFVLVNLTEQNNDVSNGYLVFLVFHIIFFKMHPISVVVRLFSHV